MPETVENETPAASPQSERTEAKFFEDADKLIAQAESLGEDYMPPNPIATVAAL
ncbi:hypothetical protein HIR19_11955, partial [Staphylococcus coagulans]|nr:hypothetical protein [Staphylococcus coagulans]